jgi:integrase
VRVEAWFRHRRGLLQRAAVLEIRRYPSRSEAVIAELGFDPGRRGAPTDHRVGVRLRQHNGSILSDKPMSQSDAWRMIRRRAVAAGMAEAIGCHTFRATGITAYLANGGALEHAQEMAAHESPRTTKLYDRTKERLTQDEVERIRL